MADEMSPELTEYYGKAKQVQQIARRNPRVGNMSPRDQVKTLLRKKGKNGSPNPVDDSTKNKNDQAVKDYLEDKGILNLPRMGATNKPVGVSPGPTVSPKPRPPKIDPEAGGPKEDLREISGQLSKASKLHGNQSKRVAGIAKGMKGDVGNPHMKRGKSKYGM